jgi:hypothetical protein
MEMVDSKQRLVEGPSIIPIAMNNLGVEHYYPKKEFSFAQAMIAMAKETTSDKVDIIQIGNTIFLSYKEPKNSMVGRIFNVDTPENFVTNLLKYISYLQKKKIKHYRTYIEELLYQALSNFRTVFEDIDTDIRINRLESNEYLIDITVGKEKVS